MDGASVNPKLFRDLHDRQSLLKKDRDLAGLVLMRQRPGSAKGTMFITLEDETGIGTLLVWLSVANTSGSAATSNGRRTEVYEDPGGETFGRYTKITAPVITV